MEPREWHTSCSTRRFIVSTDQSHLSNAYIQASLDDPDMYWSKKMTPESLVTMRRNSCIFGLFENLTPAPASCTPHTTLAQPQETQPTTPARKLQEIGLARLITDHTTFAYLTDVFVSRSHRRLGLGRWLIECVRDMTFQFPDLRRVVLMSKPDAASVGFYGKVLGAKVYDQQGGKVVVMSTANVGLDSRGE